jgi:hypothetical protein
MPKVLVMRVRISDVTRLEALGGALLVVSLLLTSPRVAAAAPAAAASADVAHLEGEVAHLRAELDRVNADVAALKRADRGVRNDYRLRQRLADAEALARKLTEAEAQLRARQGAPAPTRAPALAPPSAAPGDGPIELEAKADLLSDQARRLSGEAEGLARTASQIRGRQLLNRRANQLDRDPFAGLDSSKRSLVFGGARAVTVKNGGDNAGKQVRGGPTASDSSSHGGAMGGGTGGSMGGNTTPPTTGNTGNTAGPMAAPGTSAPGAQTPPTTPAPVTTTQPPSRTPTVEVAGPPPQPTSALSTQLRTLLDPATLSEVQRLERSGRPITDPETLDRLAAALRQRAQALDGQAKSLRAQARP